VVFPDAKEAFGAHGHGDAISRRAVPYPNRLVVGRRDNPWHFMMELDGPYVVEMSVEGEEAFPTLRSNIPDFDLVVVSASD
jgi:hypothetical protein